MNKLARDNGLRAPRWVPNDVVKKKYVEAFIYDEYTYGGVCSPESEAVSRLFVFKGLEAAFDLAQNFEKERERKRTEELLEALGINAEGVSMDVVKSDMLGLNPGGASVDAYVEKVIHDEWDGSYGQDSVGVMQMIPTTFKKPSWWTRLARYFGFW